MHTDVLPFPFSPLPAIFTGRDRTTTVVSRSSGRKQATCFFFFLFSFLSLVEEQENLWGANLRSGSVLLLASRDL